MVRESLQAALKSLLRCYPYRGQSVFYFADNVYARSRMLGAYFYGENPQGGAAWIDFLD